MYSIPEKDYFISILERNYCGTFSKRCRSDRNSIPCLISCIPISMRNVFYSRERLFHFYPREELLRNLQQEEQELQKFYSQLDLMYSFFNEEMYYIPEIDYFISILERNYCGTFSKRSRSDRSSIPS